MTRYSEFINFPIYVWTEEEKTVEVPVVEEEITEEEKAASELAKGARAGGARARALPTACMRCARCLLLAAADRAA